MINKKSLITLSLVGCLTTIGVSILSCEKKKAALEPKAPVSACKTMKYSTDIAPIFASKCYGCHTDTTGSAGGVNLNTYDLVKVIVNDGRLKSTTIDWAEPSKMPKDEKLADSLITKLKCWIEQGVPNN